MDTGLREELLRRAERDQQARAQHQPGSSGWGEVRRLDHDNTAWLDLVIDEHGWPGHALVGTEAAHAAWLLAQHADAEHQQQWVGLLRAAVDRGEAQARDWAYLADRVETRQRRPQRFGTQWVDTGDGRGYRLFPLVDPAQVNTWRAEFGLPPVSRADVEAAWCAEDLWTD
ncbi:DUF6624 domain-containing protein [Saccharopolyspora tripterygii]